MRGKRPHFNTPTLVLIAAALAVGLAAGEARAECAVDGRFDTADLQTAMAAALGESPAPSCPDVDTNADGEITVDEVRNAAAVSGVALGGVLNAVSTLAAPSGVPGADIGSASGAPGEMVEFSVTFRTGGFAIAGMQNDIDLDMANVPVLADTNGRPDCRYGLFAFRPFGCSGASCAGTRALIFGSVPDGAVLYTCRIKIAPTAPLGDYPLRISNLILATPEGNRVPGVTGTDGVIHVRPGIPLIRGDRLNPHNRRRGCQVEWAVVNASNPLDKFGLLKDEVVCEDASSSCDFLPDPGACEFHVRVCLNNFDPTLPDCQPNGIQAVSVPRPFATWGTLPPVAATVSADAAALEYAVNHLQDPTNPTAGFVYAPPLAETQDGYCSDTFPVRVIVGGLYRSSVILRVRSYDRSAPRPRRELSHLKLVCRSRPLP